MSAPIVLVVAPAGSGKTSLVADWTQQSGRATAWLTAEESDRDPTQFWAALAGALAPLATRREELSRPRRWSGPLPWVTETIFGAFESEAPEEVVLVIDDIQVLDDTGPTMTALAAFLRSLPKWLHVTLLSRRAPPLPVDRFRARGQLSEIHFEELLFSQDEAVDVLAGIAPDLDEEEAKAAAVTADGWAAGLQLTALASRAEHVRRASVLARDSGVPLISDYVWHEVLAGEQPSVVQVLIDTSVVERTNASLAATLTHRADAAELLLEAERRGLFVTRLGASGWVSIHPLVREVLLEKASAESPSRVAALRVRAARWLEDAGEISAALEQWQRARQPRETLRLLARHATDLYDLGREETIVRTVAQVPPNVTAGSLEAAIELAWCQLLSDRRGFVNAVHRAGAMAGAADARVDRTSRGRLHMLQAIAATINGDWSDVTPRVRTAKHELGPAYSQDSLGRFAQIMLVRTLALRELWDDEAAEVQEAEIDLVRDPGRRLALESCRALGQVLAGRPIDALRTAAGVRHAADVANLTIQRMELRTAEALAHREIGDRDRAHSLLEGLVRSPTEPITYAHALALLELTELYLDHAELRLAEETFGTAVEFIRTDMPGRDIRARLACSGARLALVVGDTTAAVRWAGSSSDAFWGPANRARVALAQGERRRAAQALREAEPRCERHRVVAGLLSARAQGETPIDRPSEVIAAAAAAGMLQTVAQETADVPGMLETVAWSAPPEWVSRLRRAARPQVRFHGAADVPGEHLTDRELEVLRMLPGRLTMREIADELGISLNTVKFHVKEIYRKLGITSRSEAAGAARRMASLRSRPEDARLVR